MSFINLAALNMTHMTAIALRFDFDVLLDIRLWGTSFNKWHITKMRPCFTKSKHCHRTVFAASRHVSQPSAHVAHYIFCKIL